MSNLPRKLIIAAAATLLAAGVMAAEIRRSAPGGSSAGASRGITRTPSLPRRTVSPPTVTRTPAAAPQVRPPTVSRAPAVAPQIRTPAVTRSPAATAARPNSIVRDWSYPRSSGTTGVVVRPQVPARATVTPARPNLPARTGQPIVTERRTAPGFTGTRDLTRQPRTREPYVNLNQGARSGATAWSRDIRRPEAPRATAGFSHRLDRHWDVDTRRRMARDVRGRVHGHDYFRPGWNGYTRSWAASPRWSPWQNYWNWNGWRPYHWWRAPAWPVVATWIPATTWTTYIPYDYGDNIIYQNNVVYQNGQQIATAPEYAAQAMQLADVDVPPPPQLPDNATATPQAAGDWQPLGVFALVTDEDATPTMFLQLALSRQGYISGTYYNQLTGESRPVAGSVDPRTQRAAWRIGDNTTTVMEAGLYNLTQDQAPVLIHFGKEDTEDYLLVRMEQPTEGASGTAGFDYEGAD